MEIYVNISYPGHALLLRLVNVVLLAKCKRTFVRLVILLTFISTENGQNGEKGGAGLNIIRYVCTCTFYSTVK